MSEGPAPGAAASVKAGVAYFALLFAVGFGLGTVRTLVLAPRLGALGAVLIELPVILAISWAICRWLVMRFAVGPAWSERLLMGIVAFVLLLLAELILSVAAFGGTAAGFVAAFGTSAGAAGLAGQVLFGVMPLVVRRGPA